MDRELAGLKRFGPLLVSLWGWSMLAVSVASVVVGLGACGLGFVGAALSLRAPRGAVVLEGGALLVVIAFAPTAQIGYVALGAILVVGARLLARLASRDLG